MKRTFTMQSTDINKFMSILKTIPVHLKLNHTNPWKTTSCDTDTKSNKISGYSNKFYL